MKFFLNTGEVITVSNANYQETAGALNNANVTHWYSAKGGTWVASMIDGNLMLTDSAQYRREDKKEFTLDHIEGRIISFDNFSYSELRKIINFKKLLTRFSTRTGKLKAK